MAALPAPVHGVMECGQKSVKLVWRCHQLLSEGLGNGHLSRVSRQSANDKGGNEKTQEAVHMSPGIYLTAYENSGNPQLGEGQ